MSRTLLFEIIRVVAFLVAGTSIIASSGADLAVSAPFCLGGKWPVGYQFPWQALYKLDRAPAILLALMGLVAFIGSFLRQNLRQWRRAGAFLVLLLAFGPGLMVNVVFKDHWGRPRPREIVQFGGQKQFLQPWQKGEDGQGRSFPSGHASAGFYMTGPYFIYRYRNKRLAHIWFGAGLFFGLLMSVARITQGAHFLSDNLWAWGMVHLTALVLAAALKPELAPIDPTEAGQAPCST